MLDGSGVLIAWLIAEDLDQGRIYTDAVTFHGVVIRESGNTGLNPQTQQLRVFFNLGLS